MANSYSIGTLVRMTVTFTASGVNTDPGAVTGTLKDPSGVVSSPAVVRDATGQYHMDFLASLAGVHFYHFAGTGGLTASGDGAFVVNPMEA